MSTTTTRPAARPATSTTRAVRLTRRGRAVVLVVLLGLLLTAFTLGRSDTSRAATEAPSRSGYTATTVRTGETLWAVARRVSPGRDPRALVQRLREINHLPTASVEAGQQLLVPVLG